MKYVSYATYATDKAKIAAHRPKHREYLSELLNQGKLVTAGPFMDDSGTLFIYEADSAEAASALVAADRFPFTACSKGSSSSRGNSYSRIWRCCKRAASRTLLYWRGVGEGVRRPRRGNDRVLGCGYGETAPHVRGRGPEFIAL